VPINRLCIKLNDYGIRGSILKWIENFLTNRAQQVVAYGEYSQPSSGVPQGKTKISVLLHFQPCSTCYTTVPINSCLKSSFVSNCYEKYQWFVCERKPSCATTKFTLFIISKMQRRALAKSIKNALQYIKRHL